MIGLTRFFPVFVAMPLLAPATAAAQQLTPDPGPEQTLVVGTKAAPPFAVKGDDGRWRGISIELWRGIARDLGYRFELRELELDEMLGRVADGSLDVAVAAVTITAGREQRLDFSQPFHVAGLGIAVPTQTQGGWLGVTKQFFSPEFLRIIFGIGGLLVVVGTLVWYFEHRRNTEQFGGDTVEGLGASIWWSAVTMTTVGYGDKAPRTLGGRLVALAWMFGGVVLISIFTAAMTSSLTVGQLQGPVQGPEDLAGVRVAAIDNSTSAAYLDSRNLSFASYASPADALAALDRGELDAVVYDAPILRYEINAGFRGRLRVLPGTFEQQYYGIAFRGGSALREPVNRALLARITAPGWQAVLAQYLGQ